MYILRAETHNQAGQKRTMSRRFSQSAGQSVWEAATESLHKRHDKGYLYHGVGVVIETRGGDLRGIVDPDRLVIEPWEG